MPHMDIYQIKNLWKGALFLAAVGIGVLTWWYTEELSAKLRDEEERKVQLWALAMEQILQADPTTDFTMALEIIKFNETIPIILTDDKGVILLHRNVEDITRSGLEAELQEMMEYAADPIKVEVKPGEEQFIYRNESKILRHLRFYPRFLLGIIGAYILLAYWGFSRARKGEQDRVWTGMARETAHQLGTPLTALYGWTTILEEEGVAPGAVAEIKKDLLRLQTVADRFSKIGSEGHGEKGDLNALIHQTVDYLKRRSSDAVKFQVEIPAKLPLIPMQPILLGWVMENLMRNGIDAMEGSGTLTITVQLLADKVRVDFMDTGSGMSLRVKRSVFQPGFTTKTRGWGLGLSLSRRIIQTGHKGKLTVHQTSPGEGSTFRLELPR